MPSAASNPTGERMKIPPRLRWRFAETVKSILSAIIILCACAATNAQTAPPPPGKLVDLGGHRLHVNCTGQGNPTVVVENGLGDFSFDWILVQRQVSKFTRICTYDRAGYAWSDPGPKPRTVDQLNLELHDALLKLGEHGPFVLVGHSFGGPVIRNFAKTFPDDVAGMVLVDAAYESGRYFFRGKAIPLLDGATGKPIPAPHETMNDGDKPPLKSSQVSSGQNSLDPLYKLLPAPEQELQMWAQALPGIQDAENSQREWSAEYLQKMYDTQQDGSLGSIPLVVLTRAEGGFDNDFDISAAKLEQERQDGQAKLALLSTNSKQIMVHSGHNMDLEAADDVTAAIRDVVEAVRKHAKL
jgi:pimeloyl-ACP methyl ester carboxylesterase